jgi:hypothetical protein
MTVHKERKSVWSCLVLFPSLCHLTHQICSNDELELYKKKYKGTTRTQYIEFSVHMHISIKDNKCDTGDCVKVLWKSTAMV